MAVHLLTCLLVSASIVMAELSSHHETSSDVQDTVLQPSMSDGETCTGVDNTCGGVPNVNIYKANTNTKNFDLLHRYGITEDIFDLTDEDRLDLITEKANLFSRETAEADFMDLSSKEREAYFLRLVNEMKDSFNARKEEDRQKVEDKKRARLYEFPKLERLDPGQVGDRRVVELVEGRTNTVITRGVRPPVFEIPDFLTTEECDHIINTAIDSGLSTSHLFGADVLKELEELEKADVSRISDQAWLQESHLGKDFLHALRIRVSKLSQLPIEMIVRSEYMQVVNYAPGGHYHAHLDTVDNDNLPCCFQTVCREKENTPDWAQCCRICRYMTVLYYLNDVEEGGETAFPIADMEDDLYEEKMTDISNQSWFNLSRHCYNSSLIVKPKKGTAVMWYSHFVSDEGYLGKVDKRSYHGGCDLVMGTKWVANFWISSPSYEDRFKPSIFY